MRNFWIGIGCVCCLFGFTGGWQCSAPSSSETFSETQNTDASVSQESEYVEPSSLQEHGVEAQYDSSADQDSLDTAVFDILVQDLDPIDDSSTREQAMPDSSGKVSDVNVLPAKTAGTVSPFLLGHYDLSGELFQYAKRPSLVQRMKQVGFSEWRIGTGRWEVGTWLLPSLTDGNSCSSELRGFPVEAMAPAGKSDFDLIKERDWFVYTDGKAVTHDMTQEHTRYQLSYLRRQLDMVETFGAQAFVSLDIMPRALAEQTQPIRTSGNLYNDPCWKTFTNAISNGRPQNLAIYTSAVIGLVRRIVEGTDGQPARKVTHWEIGNEPEFAEFWDRSYLLRQGFQGDVLQKKAMDDFFQTAFQVLMELDVYRAKSTHSHAQHLKFGLASFAQSTTAAAVLQTLDQTMLPTGKTIPLDFLSFHAYSNDPLVILKQIEQVVSVRAASRHYQQIELVLAEWGPELNGQGWDSTTMDLPLLMSSVIVWAAHLGVNRAHHTIFWDFYGQNIIRFGLLDHTEQPKPLWYAYSLLAETIGTGHTIVSIHGIIGGKLDNGTGAILATRDAAGTLRILLVHRGSVAQSVRLQLDGKLLQPASIQIFDQPNIAPRSIPAQPSILLPPRSMMLVTAKSP